MKKVISLILVSCLVLFVFASCGNNDGGEITGNTLSFSQANSVEDMQKLDGKQVNIIGYMSTLSPINGSFMYLMNLPYQSCPFCVPNTTQLSNTMEVYPKKNKKFADDGWAVWIDGDDTSTVYINNWLNPKGESYVDLAIRIRGVKDSKALHVYVPFAVSRDEIEDVSLRFNDTKILQATFSAACIVDYKKNEHTSEIAYNGKTVDIVHLSTLDYKVERLADGTMINVDLAVLHQFFDNDEAYFIWRMPHRSLNEIFRPRVSVGNFLTRLRDLITTPVVSEKYGYSIRINESRLLPEQITRIGAFHRQKLKKSVISISINEDYELNDSGCYRIHRLEENLYEDYLPGEYKRENVITYQWNQNRTDNFQGQFNFYYSITRDSISKGSMLLYMLLLLSIGVIGDAVSNAVQAFFALFT